MKPTTTSISFLLAFLCFSCNTDEIGQLNLENTSTEIIDVECSNELVWSFQIVEQDIRIKDYFQYMDSLVNYYNTIVDYPITEHIIAHANPWLINRLIDTDYYIRKNNGEFMYDQQEFVVLVQGDELSIPTGEWAANISDRLNNTWLDINIPEYALRIICKDQVRYKVPIRVGRNEIKYLATSERLENLRTKTGEGYIWEITKYPRYVNPVNAVFYESTLRDDGERTLLPQIPFLSPNINGHSWGQLIHPTTNPETLGKAYSNGCIGTSEADAWLIYYNAPIGTKIKIRYDLNVIDQEGNTIELNDIYKNPPFENI